MATNVRPRQKGDLILHWQKGEGKFPSTEVTNGRQWINKYKVIAAYSAYDHAGNPDKNGMRKVFTKIHVLLPKTICTETYLVIGAFDSEEEALNLKAYMETRFFRFLVSQFMFSQHITREAYAFVPVQDFTKEWTDAKLYKKYGIDADEQAFIESVIRPMDGDK